MKFFAIVAVFTFMAVQLSQTAPAPEDVKKEAAAPAAGIIEAVSAVAVEKVAPEAAVSKSQPAATEREVEEKKT